MYVVGEGKVLCDSLCELKPFRLSKSVTFRPIHIQFGFIQSPEKCNDIFREREKSTFAMNSNNQIPLSVTQVFTLLGQ
jgi:hypothetical protein